MSNDPTRVIVLSSASPGATLVYHRDFPEIRADGEDTKSAATHLANHLSRALDTALTDWRRQSLNQAIADVDAFVNAQA